MLYQLRSASELLIETRKRFLTSTNSTLAAQSSPIPLSPTLTLIYWLGPMPKKLGVHLIAPIHGKELRTNSLTTPSLDQKASHLKTCAKAVLATAGSFQLPQPFLKCQAESRKSSSTRTMRSARTASMLFNSTPSAFPTQSLLTTIFHYNNGVENSPRCMPNPHQTKPSSVPSSRKPLPSTTATTVISLAVTQDWLSKPSTVPLPQ